MNKAVRYILCLLIYFVPVICGKILFASVIPIADSSYVMVRQPDANFIDAYRSQKEFNYYQQPPLNNNILKELINYIKRKLGKWESHSEVIILIFKISLWILVILAIIFVITKTKLYKLFYTDKEIENPDVEFSNPDAEMIDFDEAIRKQIDQRQYRQAIRLLYIQLISQLRVKDYIQYSKEKTNNDYIREITNNDLRTDFYKVTSIYNYVWYGDVEIEKDQFLRFEKIFQSFYIIINDQK